jgi:hypothetical protein
MRAVLADNSTQTPTQNTIMFVPGLVPILMSGLKTSLQSIPYSGSSTVYEVHQFFAYTPEL